MIHYELSTYIDLPQTIALKNATKHIIQVVIELLSKLGRWVK